MLSRKMYSTQSICLESVEGYSSFLLFHSKDAGLLYPSSKNIQPMIWNQKLKSQPPWREKNVKNLKCGKVLKPFWKRSGLFWGKWKPDLGNLDQKPRLKGAQGWNVLYLRHQHTIHPLHLNIYFRTLMTTIKLIKSPRKAKWRFSILWAITMNLYRLNFWGMIIEYSIKKKWEMKKEW